MFKLFAVVFAAVLAISFAAPAPEPKPGVLAYSAPVVAAAPAVAYSSPLISSYSAYSAPVVSAYGAYPYAAAAYSPYYSYY